MESSSSDEELNVPISCDIPECEDNASCLTEGLNGGEDGLSPINAQGLHEELIDNKSTDTVAGNENGPNTTGSSSSIKFLSSEFFDQFVCKPSTSKERPEFIRRDCSDSFQSSSSSSPELSERTSSEGCFENGCKLRKNMGKNDEKTTEASNTNKNARTEDLLFQNLRSYVRPFSFIQPEKKEYKTSEEYFSDLRLWLQQAYFWQSVTAAFPYFLLCQQFGQTNSALNQPPPPGFSFPPQFPFPFPQFPGTVHPTNFSSSSTNSSPQSPHRQQVTDGVECRIPSFWKRIAAEFIDFMILFFVKIAVTYVAIDFFHLVDLDQLELIQRDSKMAYKHFMQITQEVIILELIHRLVVCVFETFWLREGHNGQVGGATPGKSIMGLRVLYCESSVFLRENEGVIVVKPGTNLGLSTAFFRSLTKNFVLALLVPTSFAFIFFPHNRTGYDMICSTIVVEDPVIPHRIND